jgi:hydrogenase maturation protease
VRVGVYGLGNVLRRDDGFGPTVVRLLESRYSFPAESVVLKDLGTPGLDLASHFAGFDALVLIDSVADEGRPGVLVFYDREELTGAPPAQRMTQHEGDVREALWLADVQGDGPRQVRLVGVVPADLGSGPGLSPAVEGACEAACDAAILELRELGIEPEPRPEPLPTGTWWREANDVRLTVP